ncbi:MAG: hypothetical protein NTV52_18120 [Acidobacteria bacterium]|nr:hypothetical protein [Acidobacteriota bacterium]
MLPRLIAFAAGESVAGPQTALLLGEERTRWFGEGKRGSAYSVGGPQAGEVAEHLRGASSGAGQTGQARVCGLL